ncbi:MAG TPA: hypothetical protein PLY30_01850, partial [Candidatus Omnitrophota bacterium]|nr:hypothetical protein [Candidatus Omnitrophota bacterium]
LLRAELEGLRAAGITPNLDTMKVQVSAGIDLAKGNLYKIPMGFGKTLTLRVAGYLLTNNKDKTKNYTTAQGKGTLVATVNDDLAFRDALSAGAIFSKFGTRVGVIKDEMVKRTVDGKETEVPDKVGYFYDAETGEMKKTAADEVYRDADIIYGTIDKFVHRSLDEELALDKDHVIFSGRKYFVLFDEADEPLTYQSTNPFIISGGEKADAFLARSQHIRARMLALEILAAEEQSAGKALVNRSRAASKKITLTDAGLERLGEVLKGQGSELLAGTGLGADTTLWKQLVELALSVELAYNAPGEKKQYEIVTDKNGVKEIVIIGENGKLQPGSRWSNGIHTAVEVKHMAEGVEVKLDQGTRNMTKLGKFLMKSGLVENFGGASGTMDLEAMKANYNKTPVEPDVGPGSRTETLQIYKTEADKWAAFRDDVIAQHAKDIPIIIQVADGQVDRVAQDLLDHGLPKDTVIRKFDAGSDTDLAAIEKHGGEAGAITIVTRRGGRGVDIKLTEVFKKLNDEMAKTGRVFTGYSTFIDPIEANDIQFRGRVGRRGEPGVFKAFWSLEDSIFGEYLETPGVKAVLAALRGEFNAAGDPVIETAKPGEKGPTDIADLIAAMRRSIMDSRIKQAKSEEQYDDEIDRRKAEFLKLREAVLNENYSDVALNDALPGIAAAAAGIAPADKVTFRRGILEVLDRGLSRYLDPVGNARADLVRESQEDWIGAAAQQDPYVKFRGISASAHANAMDFVRLLASQKTMGRISAERAQPFLNINWTTVRTKVVSYGVIGSVIAGMVWFISAATKYIGIVQALASTGATMAEVVAKFKLLSMLASAFTALPAALWVVAAIVLVAVGFTLTQLYVKRFSQSYKGQQKLSLAFKGLATRQEAAEALLSFPVQLLTMTGAMMPATSLFALIAALAFPVTAPVLIPAAVVMAAIGVLSSVALIAFNYKRHIKDTKLDQASNFSRGLRVVFFGLTAITGGGMLLMLVPSKVPGLLAAVAIGRTG